MTTIAAAATPPGSGAIGVIRLSGPDSLAALSRLFVSASDKFSGFQPWKLHHGSLLDQQGELLDDVLAVYMPGPNTYTGEESAEIHCHGSAVTIRAILDELFKLGVVQAEKGEFSRRAFLNGRMDLSQAEAVAELIAAPTRQAQRFSLKRLDGSLGLQTRKIRDLLDEARKIGALGMDFPDDELQACDMVQFREITASAAAAIEALLKSADSALLLEVGATILLVGSVNAGKSSLLNALAGRDRALVADLPGTTRDFLEISLNLDGLAVKVIDTAGFRHDGEADELERQGMEKVFTLLAEADAVVHVLDSSRIAPEYLADEEKIARKILEKWDGGKYLIARNKIDIADTATGLAPFFDALPACGVSALTGENLPEFNSFLGKALLDGPHESEGCLAPNARQAQALSRALEELKQLEDDLAARVPLDCAMARLDAACGQLDSLLGLAASSEILERIFSSFCIGK